MYVNLWVMEWCDRGRGGEAIDTATTPQDALATIHRFLDHETAFDESTRKDRPAFDVLFDGVDPITMVQEMDDRLELECESGDFMVRRTMRFKDESPKPAAPRVAASASRITEDMIKRLKEDYLSWSGGFRPDEDDQVAVYVAMARPSDISVHDAWAIINQWIADVEDESRLPRPDLVFRPSGNVTRERSSNAVPELLDFAKLFLAYHDNLTNDEVTIGTLERIARAAVAKAERLSQGEQRMT
jgi:hypothetical protein